ncbi:hypothetical protein OIU84_007238 [Salix udensis]|uniref:RecQ-mediated genome instability protein 1 n=1 Tax=Salix udensis TaxID=889485 RepID=A0AAD6JSM8_9ROSI|nr:hypothetical protein OIU84_007238 [Salix udensis]KAJ6410450.1 hypothetical protein OIU84_007238 [Salix udensis]
MTRRRLRLSSYSDDEDDEEHSQQQDYQMESHQLPNPFPNPSLTEQPVPLPISSDDADFADASDDFTPMSPPSVDPPISGCPTGDFLLRTGLSLKREWLDSCLRQIDNSLDIASKAKLCFAQFLISDMNQCGAGVLPPNVDSMHLADLPGPFVLQVDEIVNISCPLKGRYQDTNVGVKRCLKLSMTDGVQRVYGMEYRPIKDLKVAICNVHIRHGLLMLVPEALEVLGGVVEELEAARQRLADEISKPPRGRRSRTGENNNGSGNALRRTDSSVNVVQHTDRSISQAATSFQEDGRGANLVTSGTVTSQRTVEECAVPMSAETTMSNLPSSIVSDVGEMHINAPSISGASSVSNQHSNGTLEQEDVRMTVEFEHPLILSRDREIPFTYLASLSAKWAAMKEKEPSVRGKIKCFLTGVKGFQYKQRTTYELQVYVDDGSLISEILINHNVVLKGIGCSPVEVTAALSSSDTKRVGEMKETLRQFQMFLVNFEGTMLVEINGASKLPVALEMNQGCPSSDAWLLMRRLKSFFFCPNIAAFLHGTH